MVNYPRCEPSGTISTWNRAVLKIPAKIPCEKNRIAGTVGKVTLPCIIYKPSLHFKRNALLFLFSPVELARYSKKNITKESRNLLGNIRIYREYGSDECLYRVQKIRYKKNGGETKNAWRLPRWRSMWRGRGKGRIRTTYVRFGTSETKGAYRSTRELHFTSDYLEL